MVGFFGLVSTLAGGALLLSAALAPLPAPQEKAPAPTPAATKPDAAGFPASWAGVWRGPARTTNRNGGGFAFGVELVIAPTGKPDRFQWTIVYESNEMRRQERPYELLVKDAEKGLYAIDEKNGIVIDAWFVDGALYSHFVVEGNRISVVERLTTGPTGEPEIVFELVTVADEDLRGSGGEGGMPAVRAAAPRSVQRSVLRRVEPR